MRKEIETAIPLNLRKGGVVKPKYWVDTSKRKHFKEPIFNVVRVVTINEAAVDDFVRRNRRLPDHVYRTEVDDEERQASTN